MRGLTSNDPLKEISLQDLAIDEQAEIERISSFIRNSLAVNLKRRGTIIALSGGIDSSVTAALCVKALGPQRVIGLLMPEQHSSGDSSRLAILLASHLGIQYIQHDITSILEATGCYKRQDEAIQATIPQYKPGNPFKIILPAGNNQKYRIFSLVVQDSSGNVYKQRMSHESYLSLVAATNFKQRVRKMMEYYYADRYNYAVAGSPNRLEFDQGFFVKSGDGAADLKPIAHLYKTQVYALAKALSIPQEIQDRLPTTDTYPMEQSQEEFFFSLPYQKMDLCLFAKISGLPPQSICKATGLSLSEAISAFEDIDAKRKSSRYLHQKPLLVSELTDIR